MPMKWCIEATCRETTTTTRCAMHARTHDAERRAVYDSTAYRAARTAMLSAWRAAHGPWCPGWGVDSHPAHDLTIDHVVSLEAGGPAIDTRNLGVLCRPCNARKRDT